MSIGQDLKISLIHHVETFEYMLQFDHEISQFLLDLEQKYGRISYKLKLKVYEPKGYKTLIEFLKAVQRPEMLMIDQILWSFTIGDVAYYNELYQ